MTSQLTEEEEKAKNLGKVKNKQEMMMVDLEGKSLLHLLLSWLEFWSRLTMRAPPFSVMLAFDNGGFF